MTYTPITDWNGALFQRQLRRALDELDGGMSVAQAEREVLSTWGDNVSVLAKAKSLFKFGRNEDVDTAARETIWAQGGDETYVATNLIDSVSSSSASDTGTIGLEYHTVTGTGASAQFTFGVQTVALNGQTRVALPTPCARVSRGYNASALNFVGDVYVYENTAITAGVPTDDTKIHMKLPAGDSQSFKAATTLSNSDYLFVTSVYASVRRGTSAVADMQLEIREVGGVFRPRLSFSVSQSGGAFYMPIEPYIIVPKNADVRITAATNTNNTQIDAGLNGVLALIQ